jgi:hypothetical protein
MGRSLSTPVYAGPVIAATTFGISRTSCMQRHVVHRGSLHNLMRMKYRTVFFNARYACAYA